MPRSHRATTPRRRLSQEDNGVEFPLLSDDAREVTRAYDVALDNFAGMPGYTASKRAVFIVDQGGTVTYAWEGPNPGVEPDYEAVVRAL